MASDKIVYDPEGDEHLYVATPPGQQRAVGTPRPNPPGAQSGPQQPSTLRHAGDWTDTTTARYQQQPDLTGFTVGSYGDPRFGPQFTYGPGTHNPSYSFGPPGGESFARGPDAHDPFTASGFYHRRQSTAGEDRDSARTPIAREEGNAPAPASENEPPAGGGQHDAESTYSSLFGSPSSQARDEEEGEEHRKKTGGEGAIGKIVEKAGNLLGGSKGSGEDPATEKDRHDKPRGSRRRDG